MGNFFFLEGENKWGEIYTSLLATQVCFAHLLRSQGDYRIWDGTNNSDLKIQLAVTKGRKSNTFRAGNTHFKALFDDLKCFDRFDLFKL